MISTQQPAANLMQELVELGNVCRLGGELRRAEQHYQLALSLYETSFPDRHVEAMVCLLALIDVLNSQGKIAEAKNLEDSIPTLNARRRIST